MAENTKIEWATHTFNPWIGCTRISPGCDHCYAASLAQRYGWVTWGEPGVKGTYKRTSDENWRKPLRWAKAARKANLESLMSQQPFPHRPRVFCASLADVFDNQVPEEWRHDLWRLIRETPELDWLLLTKRPENIERFLPAYWHSNWKYGWSNIWLGFTAEDQPHFDRRWPIVRDIPAAVRFCSYEPALGDLTVVYAEGLDWLICGGESGPGHRPMDLAWEQAVRLQCETVGISYFCKQNSGKKPFPEGYPIVREFPILRCST